MVLTKERCDQAADISGAADDQDPHARIMRFDERYRSLTIHGTDPFATPDVQRSPVRRLRGRLPAAVTLWTAPGPAGLTVSSTLIADGEPGRVLGLIDDESELWSAIESAGRFAVIPLAPRHRQLADRFAGLMPAPGGLFRGEAW